MNACDYLIVGGGTAGAVLASRLTEDAATRVILLEAGRDIRPDAVPDDIRDLFPMSSFNPSYCWPGLRAHWRGRTNSPAVPLQQARLLGGGSAIMGMWATRGVPEDYDGWARLGADGWGWGDVLPYFRRLETDRDFDGDLHGDSGPLPIVRQPGSEWSALAVAARDLCGTQIDDMNADFGDGYCVLPISRTPEQRASAGLNYLTSSVRQRPNLRVVTGIDAEKLLFDGQRICGAAGRLASGERVEFSGRRTVLAAGAIQTPLLLMRSGIGPGEVLRAAGIAVSHEAPGVGRNLQNHPLLLAFGWLEPGARDARRGRPPASTYMRWSSGLAGTHRGDMGLYVRSYVAWHALGRQLAMIGPVLMRPFSRGDVTPTGPQPADPASIAFNFLSDPRDEDRMVAGLQRAAALLDALASRGSIGRPFAIMNPARLGRFNAVSRANAVLSGSAALLKQLFPRLAEGALARFAGFRPLAGIMASDTRMRDFVRDQTAGTFHVAGTARMGRAGDPAAVVGPDGAVHGLDGLFVADASIMPTVPSGNTHIPVVMLAEKLAAVMRGAPLHA